MPLENRRGSYQDHGFEQRVRLGRQGRDQPSVQSAEPGTRRQAAEHDELVAEQEVLGGDDRARGEESQDDRDYVAKEVDHRAILGPVFSQVQPRRVDTLSAAPHRVFAAHRGSWVAKGKPTDDRYGASLDEMFVAHLERAVAGMIWPTDSVEPKRAPVNVVNPVDYFMKVVARSQGSAGDREST
jgi:hypothetical protein